jgi:hypothetical protein
MRPAAAGGAGLGGFVLPVGLLEEDDVDAPDDDAA